MDGKQETRTGEQEREETQAKRVSPVQAGEVAQTSTPAEMDIVGGSLETNDTISVIGPRTRPQARVLARRPPRNLSRKT
jgi:hypothetical protein